MVAAKAAKASSQKEWTEAINFRLSAVRSSSDIISWWLYMASAINGARSPICFRISGVYSAPSSRSPSSSAPISLPWTFNGAMHLNHTLEIFPVELKNVSQRSREIRCGPGTLVRACTCLGRSGKTAVWGKTTKPCAAIEASMAGFSWKRKSAPEPARIAAITTSSAPLAVWERSRSPVNTGPSSARTWEASSGGLLVKKESAKFLERRELQSTLRVTAYVLHEKGLSIGMVNRKVVAYGLENAKELCKCHAAR